MQKFEIQNLKAREARIVSNVPPTNFVRYLVASKYKCLTLQSKISHMVRKHKNM